MMKKSSKKEGSLLSVSAKKQVRNMINSLKELPPLKCLDVLSATTYDTTGAVVFCTFPAQGVGFNQRTGDEIEIDHVEVRLNAFVADTTNIVRIVLVQSHGQQTGNYASNAIFASGASNTIDVTSFILPYRKEQIFSVLLDEEVLLCTNASNAQWTRHWKSIVPPIRKIGFGAATTNALQGQMQFYILSDSSAASHPAVDVVFRFWYRDI